eukprot:COSAG04_NODE_16446_length_498_cov_14.333333_1_plen_57_part_10
MLALTAAVESTTTAFCESARSRTLELDESALKTLRDKFDLEDDDEVAAASFRRKIDR